MGQNTSFREETLSGVRPAVKSAQREALGPPRLAKFGLLIAAPGAPPSFGDQATAASRSRGSFRIVEHASSRADAACATNSGFHRPAPPSPSTSRPNES